VACCPVHLPLHRPRDFCLPVTVEEREGKGRVIVAARDIKPFEVVLVDRPAIVGPFDDARPQCVECYAEWEGGYSCEHCNLPLCGPGCADGPTHRPECEVLRHAEPGLAVSGSEDHHPVYSAIAPLRMLAVRRDQPQVWSMVDRLMDHLDLRRKEKKWDFIRDEVLPLIVSRCGYTDCDPEVIERIVGIFRTNSVKWEQRRGEAPAPTPVGHALCPLFSVLCHSCVNNTRYSQTAAGELVVRAATIIRAGEEVTTQYRGPNTGNILRRPDFPANWHFQCGCERCEDPTELGTQASTLVCPACSASALLPASPAPNSDYRCGECGREEDRQQVVQLVERLEARLDSQDYSDPPNCWEEFLTSLGTQLHPDHFICMKAKRILLQIYGSREGYKLSQLPRRLLDRKIQLCTNYISIFSRLEPGYRVWKGRLLEGRVIGHENSFRR